MYIQQKSTVPVIYVEVREVCEGNAIGVGGTTSGVGGTRISNDRKMIYAIKSARETGKRAGHPAAARIFSKY